eukprot:1176015-Prorocentrum_minimum.AAC.4
MAQHARRRLRPWRGRPRIWQGPPRFSRGRPRIWRDRGGLWPGCKREDGVEGTEAARRSRRGVRSGQAESRVETPRTSVNTGSTCRRAAPRVASCVST